MAETSAKQTSTKATKKGFFISQIFKQAWIVFKKKWSTVLLLFAASIGLMVAFMALSENEPNPLVGLLYFVVQLIMGMIYIKVFVDLYREKEVSFEVVGEVLPQIGHYFLGIIFYTLLVLGGLILLIVPGIYLALKYSMTLYLIVDQKMGVFAAFKESARLTKGVEWDMIGFFYAAVILAYLGLLALLVGFLITAPVVMLAMAGLYQTLAQRAKK